MDTTVTRTTKSAKKAFRDKVYDFGRDESGSMIVFTLFLLVLMLIVSGMAVDFMRFESRRAELQGCTDNAVLAAADLDQAQDPKAVATDYFVNCASIDQLQGEPVVTPGSESRQVTVNGKVELPTFFLKLIGMKKLTATASSTAIEGVGEIEVSLVVDISGSMGFELVNDDGTTPTMVDPDTGLTRNVTRMDRLQEAANGFVTTLLSAENRDKISISLVPYSEHVNPGEHLFGALTTNTMHNYSHCVEFEPAHFQTTSLDRTHVYDQVQHIQFNPETDSSGRYIPLITEPVCPFRPFERIVPLTQDAGFLTGIIDQLEPRAGTSIFLGLKWGAALIDPSIKPLLATLPAGTIDANFGDRPAPYPNPNSTGDTRKYIVLMTDGQNDRSNRLHDFAYNSPSDYAHWAQENFWHFISTDAGWDSSWNWRYEKYTATLGDTYMANMCDQLKDPAKAIVVFTISLGSSDDPIKDAHGWEQMRNCATTPNLFFQTDGEALVEIFEDIAEQITDLRLTQ